MHPPMAAAITTAVVARIILFAFMLVLFLKSIQTPPYFQTLADILRIYSFPRKKEPDDSRYPGSWQVNTQTDIRISSNFR